MAYLCHRKAFAGRSVPVTRPPRGEHRLASNQRESARGAPRSSQTAPPNRVTAIRIWESEAQADRNPGGSGEIYAPKSRAYRDKG